MESRKKNALNRLGLEEECGRSESGKARLSRDPASMQCGPPPEGQGYTDVLKSQRMACLKKSEEWPPYGTDTDQLEGCHSHRLGTEAGPGPQAEQAG